MKRSHIFIAATTLSVASLVVGYPLLKSQLSGKQHPQKNNDAVSQAAPSSAQNLPAAITPPALQGSRTSLENILDQVIADAIQNGSLNIASLTPAQLALLPSKFKVKTPLLGEAAIALASQVEGLGSIPNDAPEEGPKKTDCPQPGHLPDVWNNEYNKSILRARGCTL
jgi:hypothetical protein